MTTTLPDLPASRQAIVQSAKNPGSLELSVNQPMPDLPADHVLIKVAAVALNHCDYKMPARVPCPGAVDGADFSGTVMRVGEVAALDTGLKIGDRVAGAQMASNRHRPWCGAFSEYIVEKAVTLWRVPENMSWEQAASIGCAVTSSVGMALYYSLKLTGTPEEPSPDAKFVLVYGGSTASGTFAIQILKLQAELLSSVLCE